MTRNNDLMECYKETVRLMHESEFYKPDTNGLSSGWSFWEKDVVDDPMAIGSITVELHVARTSIAVRRVMMKSDDPAELAQDIVAEFSLKAEEVRKQTRESVKQTCEENIDTDPPNEV